MAKRRRKKSHRLYALIVILLGIAIIAATFLLLFYVQKIEVKGNEYTEDKVIIESVQEDRFSFNSMYLLIKYRFAKHDVPGSLTSMKVSLKNPWTVKITVQEKPIIGYLYESDNYVFFDKEGMVVLKGREMIAEVPCIEGIDIGKTKLYEPLQVKSEKLLKAILSVAQEVENFELKPDRIVCTDEGIELYFGNIRVMLGTDINTEKMAQISPILAKLEGRAGTLHLEHFESETNSITFTADSPAEDSEADTADEPSGADDGGDDVSSDDGYSEESEDDDYYDGESDDYYDDSYDEEIY
ncbi:MAG: hypothetical protein Q4C52_00105 [Eubacteriales bacterium]|nr:hypothetical protein [Eubacteriales bacterium]